MTTLQLPESTRLALMEYREAKEKWFDGDSLSEENLKAYRAACVSLAINIDHDYKVFEAAQ